MSQHEKMRNSLLLNFKTGPSQKITMSAILDTTGKKQETDQARRLQQRAQSATYNKNPIKHVINKYDSMGEARTTSGDLSKMILKSLPSNQRTGLEAQRKNNINVNSERDLQTLALNSNSLPQDESTNVLITTTKATIHAEKKLLKETVDAAYDATIS